MVRFVVMAILIGAGIAWGASYWKPYNPAAEGGNATQSCDCGGIQGTVGAIVPWSLVPSGASSIVSHADLGGQWGGSEYPLATAPTVIVPDEHIHRWEKVGGGTPSAITLQVAAYVTAAQEGSADQLRKDDPQWWWVPNVTFEQKPVAVQRLVPGAPNWETLNWTAVHDDTLGSYASQNGGQAGSPSGVGTDGTFRASITLPASMSGAVVKITFPFTTTGAATSDNAEVSGWKEYVHYDAMSRVTSASASEDFDSWFEE